MMFIVICPRLRRLMLDRSKTYSDEDQKKKTKGILVLEVRLIILVTRFEIDDTVRKQYLEGLSFFVANKK
jgi:hypothetical protein